MDSKQLAQYIDHTALTAEKTEQDILKLCDEAIQYGFYSVCINSGYIPLAKRKTRWLRCKNLYCSRFSTRCQLILSQSV